MLKNNIEDLLKKQLSFEPTESQKGLLPKLADFIIRNDERDILVLKGYAGTGKTTMVNTLVQALKELSIRCVLLAPTGRAAKVLTSYTQKQAYTIHKKIYRQKAAKDAFGNFVLDKNLYSNTFFIVDEASMIGDRSTQSIFGSGNLLGDLLEYVYTGKRCKLMLIGDVAQLPPVGLNLSPALAPDVYNIKNIKYIEHLLVDVVRQKQGSGILLNATLLRNTLEKKEIEESITFQSKDFPDVIPVTGKSLIEEISECYDKFGIGQTMIICRSNYRANRFNQGIRNQILWRDEEITVGDRLLVVKNNYYWVEENPYLDFIANGDIGEIVKIVNYEERYGYQYANVVLKLPDYNDMEIDCKILLETLHSQTASMPADDMKELFYKVCEDYSEENSRKTMYKKVKEDEFFNALQVKFAYAVTCHKAQGGQWKVVFLDQGSIPDGKLDKDYLRWMYTGFTRATERLYLVNFDKKFLEEEIEYL